MKIKEAVTKVTEFMKMSQRSILEKFAAESKDAVLFHAEPRDYSFCFIPGTRKDRVLMVAHIDTVWKKQVKVQPVIHPKYPNILIGQYIVDPENENSAYMGIGADDRAGVAILWELRKLGHSILLISGEEKGCLGSGYFMQNAKTADLLKNHSFAIEFDRHDNDDLVFYNVGTKEFEEYCEKSTGFKTAMGTFTDICVLCQDMCGVNISVGYKNEHTTHEFLNMDAWIRTLEASRTWLSSKDIPAFTQNKKSKKRNHALWA